MDKVKINLQPAFLFHYSEEVWKGSTWKYYLMFGVAEVYVVRIKNWLPGLLLGL